MAIVPFLTGSSGLNNIIDPVRLKYSSDTGVSELAEAVNVDIDDTGRILRRPGQEIISIGAFHSLFCDDSDCLVHDAGSMYRIENDFTVSGALRTGMSGEYVDHTKMGQAIYFGNRQERGVYSGGACSTWDVDTYTGPKTSRQFSLVAPIFDHLVSFIGMIIFSYDNMLFATEPGKFGLWEAKPVWVTDTRITLIKPVITNTSPPNGGIFVSDENRIVFLSGLLDDDTRTFSELRVADYPALEWSGSHRHLDGSLFGEKSGLCAVFATTNGTCIGYPEGQLVNVTQNKIKIDLDLTLGATVVDGNSIISIMR